MRFSLWLSSMNAMRRVGAVVGVVAVLGASRVFAAALGPHPLADRCELFRVTGVVESSSAACLRCHDGSFASAGTNHPVDMDYESAVARSRGSMMALRPMAEVVKRGVFLPNGKVTCVTCHDGRSQWKYGLAIPAGAKVSAAVNPRDPSTYVGARKAAKDAEVHAAEVQGTYGVRVTPTPLCKACHALD